METKDKQKILRHPDMEKHITFKGTTRLSADVSPSTMEANIPCTGSINMSKHLTANTEVYTERKYSSTMKVKQSHLPIKKS